MSASRLRASRATINLAALRHNLGIVKQVVNNASCMAVIKANGYGHGIIEVAQALSQDSQNIADAFGVACIDEAICLREAGISQPIVLLEGFLKADELNLVRAYNLECVVHHDYQLAILEQDTGSPVQVWLKLDTGMHRLGFSVEQAQQAYEKLLQYSSVSNNIRIMTHLANADDRDDPLTPQQCKQLNDVVTSLGFEGETSIANSAGILGWNQLCPGSHGHWVRPGIMLYGVSPFIDSYGKDHELKPVMTLSSELIAINHYNKGDAIGYSGTYTCEEDMPVGVVAIGYGDGYPRHAPTGTPVVINGKHVPLVGRVSMDMITVDLRDCPDASIGDRVELWGEELAVEEIADRAGSIGYELLCGVTRRVSFKYRDR